MPPCPSSPHQAVGADAAAGSRARAPAAPSGSVGRPSAPGTLEAGRRRLGQRAQQAPRPRRAQLRRRPAQAPVEEGVRARRRGCSSAGVEDARVTRCQRSGGIGSLRSRLRQLAAAARRGPTRQSRLTVAAATPSDLGGLLDAEPAEEAQLHDPGLPRVERRESLERLVERRAGRRRRRGGRRATVVERHSACRRRAWRRGGAGRDRPGSGASPGRRRRRSGRGSASWRCAGRPAQVGLVNQGRRLQGVVAALAAEWLRGEVGAARRRPAAAARRAPRGGRW